ncbi:MAG TPA: nitroreductase family protein [Candidatus Eisenbacteria bacterium]|nr:nitroreductase family protein [Candidatus Eisenbacteria bacterium]
MNTALRTEEKPLSDVIRDRRATDHFKPDPVAPRDLEQILRAGLEAPSGYNLQPWRFIVVRSDPQKQKLKAAAMNQPKVGEAPVVIVACGDPAGWKNGDMDETFRLAAENGYGGPAQHEAAKKSITGFLGGTLGDAGGLAPDLGLWVNRHVMIAFTHMMLMAEALGYDTAPMEGFFESKVREALEIPAHVRVVALLAIGQREGDDKKYGGRFPLSRTVFFERWEGK